MSVLEKPVSAFSIAEGAKFRTSAPPADEIRIGTSGWHYGSWRGPFYPEQVKVKEQLAFYVTQFNTAEINNSFYRLPTLKAVEQWRETVPEGFVFAWKASRFITHFRRLKDCEESIRLVFGRMGELGPSAGPVLFQLPPQMKADRERLAGFLDLLPQGGRYTFEFRHESWYEPEILDVLRDHGVALCISDHAAAPAPWEVTADFVYLRGHGPTGRYTGHYSDEALADWATSIAAWRADGRDVYVYFDNDQKSAAPKDAEKLKALV